jgi:hypothetical protein
VKRLLVIAAVLCAAPRVAGAGDRPVEIAIVDASPSADKACIKGLTAAATADDTVVHPMSLASLRKKLGVAADSDYHAWTADTFAPVHDWTRDDHLDAVVVIDCHPDLDRLEMIISPSAKAIAHLRIHRTIDKKALAWIGSELMRAASAGFSP